MSDFREGLLRAARAERERHGVDWSRPLGNESFVCLCGEFTPTSADEFNAHVESAVLDAALAFRQTVECPECGGTGVKFKPLDGLSRDSLCPAGCIDGRVPGETRLAIVRKPTPTSDWLFLLAPDLPDDRPEWERRLTSGEYDDAAPDLPEGTQP